MILIYKRRIFVKKHSICIAVVIICLIAVITALIVFGSGKNSGRNKVVK